MKNLNLLAALGLLCVVACQPSQPTPPGGSTPTPLPSVSGEPSPQPSVSPSSSPTPSPSPTSTARPLRVLLWVGANSWTPEIRDLKNHLNALSIPFDAISSLRNVVYANYSAIIMGGGQAKSRLSTIEATEEERLRQAIESGLGYLGHCAGAFMAGTYSGWGLRLSPAAYDYPAFGAITTMSQHQLAAGGVRYVLFYGGAELSGHGSVIATYRNGEPSITQFRYGKGLVVLTGGHPEVSQATINALGLSDQDGDDSVLEHQLIRAVVTNEEVQ